MLNVMLVWYGTVKALFRGFLWYFQGVFQGFYGNVQGCLGSYGTFMALRKLEATSKRPLNNGTQKISKKIYIKSRYTSYAAGFWPILTPKFGKPKFYESFEG